ncbi:MAG: inositol monophosphatase family protein [Pikeienuella sp.]
MANHEKTAEISRSAGKLSGVALDDLVDVAHRMADAGGRAARSYFRTRTLSAENKAADGFDPVTVADRASEAEIRAVATVLRPEDGILGEEDAPRSGQSGLTWIIDPIDGTRAFISGLPTWGVLIALDDGAQGRIGVVDHPALGERFLGVIGDTASRAEMTTAGGQRHKLAVRACSGLGAATLFTTDPGLFGGADQAAFSKVQAAVRLTRYGVDCYAYALLAMGQIDLVIEAGLQAYDIAAPAVLVRAAGGIVTDWQGGDPRWGGKIVAAGDPRVHSEALALLGS